jgi:hypothetical protein
LRGNPVNASTGRKATMMSHTHVIGMTILTAAALAAIAHAQAPTPPLFATTKVDGTDNVYIFRYVRHQSMFVVTPEGVIATDPIGLRRPAAKAYIDEIRKITQVPIKHVSTVIVISTMSPAVNLSRISAQSSWLTGTQRPKSSI